MDEIAPRRRESDRPRGKLRKGMYILPSLFTTANIAAGFYAILQTVHGSMGEAWHMDFAAKAIGFAVLFDGLDGRIARMTNTDSDFGRELDSLADVITFGVAPALLAWMWGFRQSAGLLASPEIVNKIRAGSAPSQVFFSSSPEPVAWPVSTSPRILSPRIPAAPARNILSECPSQLVPESSPQSCIFPAATRSSGGAAPSPGPAS
jgi:CDP-diacylglycerol--serine O-phosphatidyltransferase